MTAVLEVARAGRRRNWGCEGPDHCLKKNSAMRENRALVVFRAGGRMARGSAMIEGGVQRSVGGRGCDAWSVSGHWRQ